MNILSFPFPLVILLGRQKPGKWCAMHVRVAYMIDPHRRFSSKSELGGGWEVGWLREQTGWSGHTQKEGGQALAGTERA